YKAGQIQSATLGDIVKGLESLRAGVTLKEEELKIAQSEIFVEPTPTPGAPSAPSPSAPAPPQRGAAPPANQGQPVAVARTCPNCQFQMPASAMFCPNCGARQGA